MNRSDWSGLHVLADDDPRWPIPPLEQARAALAGSAQVIQLRAKHLSDREALSVAREIRTLTRAHDARFVVNDRFDLAWLAEADAVHLGQDDLAPEDVPAFMRERLRVGRSTHDLAQAREALLEPIDYLAFGPLFGTASKDSPYSARGLEALREVVALADRLPVVAIGGIDATNLAAVLAAGASGIAVISAVAGAEKPEASTRRLAQDSAWDARDANR